MSGTKLTKTELTIYEQVVEAAKQKDKCTVQQLAQRAGVAPSTVVKLARKIGYGGWNDMFYTLHNRYTAAAPIAYNDFHFPTLENQRAEIDDLCELLYLCRDGWVLVQGLGDVEYVANTLMAKLWDHGFRAAIYSEHQAVLAAACGAESAAILINESGLLLAGGCMQARQKGLHTVSISSSRHTPLATNSDITVELENNRSSLKEYAPNFFAARVLMFLELLFVSYREYIKAKSPE